MVKHICSTHQPPTSKTMSSRPDTVTVHPSKIEPLYIYLGVLLVVGMYAASNPLQNLYYRWTNPTTSDVDENKRAANVARSRSKMQQKLNQAKTKKKEKKEQHQQNEQEPLEPRVVSLRNRGANIAKKRSSSSTNNSNNSSTNNNSSTTNNNNTTTNNARQTQLDSFYAASLQASEELPSSSTSSSSSPLPRSAIRSRQDHAYKESLRQDHENRKRDEQKSDQEMQRAIQESMEEAKRQQLLQDEQRQIELLQSHIPPVPDEANEASGRIKKIQFRFASGKTINRTFLVSCTLGQVRAYVQYELYGMENELIQCTMSTTYPRKTYGKMEDAMTLEESELFKGGAKRISLMVQDINA